MVHFALQQFMPPPLMRVFLPGQLLSIPISLDGGGSLFSNALHPFFPPCGSGEKNKGVKSHDNTNRD
jgi:hypothetical protein